MLLALFVTAGASAAGPQSKKPTANKAAVTKAKVNKPAANSIIQEKYLAKGPRDKGVASKVSRRKLSRGKMVSIPVHVRNPKTKAPEAVRSAWIQQSEIDAISDELSIHRAAQSKVQLKKASRTVLSKANNPKLLGLTLSGSYTVGAGGNFADLGEMATALNWGTISGPVTMLLTDTSYTSGAPAIGATTGSSAINTITIQPASGNTSCVINLPDNPANGGGFVVSGASYLTIEGTAVGQAPGTQNLTFELSTAPTSQDDGTIAISGGSQSVTVSDCIVNGWNSGSFASTGISISSSGTPNVGTTVNNCNIGNCFYGVEDFAPYQETAEVWVTTSDVNTTVSNCLIGGDVSVGPVVSTGVRLLNVIGAVVNNNKLQGMIFTSAYAAQSSSDTRACGIRLMGLNCSVTNNVIDDIQYQNVTTSSKSRVYGIREQTPAAGLGNTELASDPVLTDWANYNAVGTFNSFVNNSISGLLSYGNVATYLEAGIEFFGSGYDTAYYNSISISGTAVGAHFSEGVTMWGTAYTYSGELLVNNAFSITRDNSAYGANADVIDPVLNYGYVTYSDYNVLNYNAAVGNDITPTALTNYQQYEQTGGDQHSVIGDPDFVGADNLALQPSSSSSAYQEGTAGTDSTINVAEVAKDITGATRNYPTPNAGAYETVTTGAPLHSVGLAAIEYPNASVPEGVPMSGFAVAIFNATKQTESSVPVDMVIYDATMTVQYSGSGVSGTLGWGGADTVKLSGTLAPATAGIWTAVAYTDLGDDYDRTYDTAVYKFAVAAIQTIPYVTEFQNAAQNSGWSGTGDFALGSNDPSAPNYSPKLGGAYAGGDTGQEWVTNPGLSTNDGGLEGNGPGNGSYTSETVSKLASPFFNFAGQTSGFLTLIQSISWEPGWDGDIMEYSVDTGKTFMLLGYLNDTAGGSFNWYSTTVYQNAGVTCYAVGGYTDCATAKSFGFPDFDPGADVPRWTSNGAGLGNDIPTGPFGYIPAGINLATVTGPDSILGRPGLVQFRIETWQDYGDDPGADGVAIGAFQVTSSSPTFTAGTLSGRAYTDMNGIAEYVGGDPAFSGEVYLTYFGTAVDSATTNPDGTYTFANGMTLPGTYFPLATPAGYYVTQDSNVNYAGDGSAATGVNIGFFQGSVSGKVFFDSLDLGTYQPGRTGLKGWTVELHVDSVTGALFNTATTDSNGHWSILAPPGTYYSIEDAQQYTRETWPPDTSLGARLIYPDTFYYQANYSVVDDTSGVVGANPTGVDFGDYIFGIINLGLYVNRNGSGVRAPGDLFGLPAQTAGTFTVSEGATVVAYDTIGFATTSTGVTRLDTGSYVATFTGFIQPPADSSNPWILTNGTTYPFRITVGLQSFTNNFLAYETHSVSGTVFADSNGNGAKDPGENGVAGWTVNMDGTGGGSQVSVVSTGKYTFNGVMPGAHHFTLTVQSGYTKTLGAYTDSGNNSGGNLTGKNFGVFKNVMISGEVYHDRDDNATLIAGDEGINGVVTALTGQLPDTSADGGLFSYANVGPGKFTLSATVPAGYSQSQPAAGTADTITTWYGKNVSDNFGLYKATDLAKYWTVTAAEVVAHAADKLAKAPAKGKGSYPTFDNLISSVISSGVGIGVAGIPVGSKTLASIHATKEADFVASFTDKSGSQIGQTSEGFDFSSAYKPLEGVYKSIGPKVQDNALTADLMALALNVALSNAGVTSPGLGNLVINSGPYENMSVSAFLASADTIMTKWAGVTYATFDALDSTAVHINAAFSTGTFVGVTDYDTSAAGWSIKYSSGVLKIIGGRTASSTTYLKAPTAPLAKNGLELKVIPAGYALYHNYPNPFNPTTTIRFDLPLNSTVTLKVYNMLGQEVRTLFNNQQLNAGTQEVAFDGASLSSGVYFYTINAQGVSANGAAKSFRQVLKMLLIK